MTNTMKDTMQISFRNDTYTIGINPVFESAIVPLTEAETGQLRENLEYGFDSNISQILLWKIPGETNKAYVVDGHNRYKLCREMDDGFLQDYSNFRFLEDPDIATEEDVIRWIENNQLGRRNLSKYARFEIIYRRDGEQLEKEAAERQRTGKNLSSHGDEGQEQDMVSSLGNLPQDNLSSHGNQGQKKQSGAVKDILSGLVVVAPKTIVNYIKIYRSDNEEAKAQLRMDQISVSKALKLISPEKEEQGQKETTQEEQNPTENNESEDSAEVIKLRTDLDKAQKTIDRLTETVDKYKRQSQKKDEEIRRLKEELAKLRRQKPMLDKEVEDMEPESNNVVIVPEAENVDQYDFKIPSQKPKNKKLNGSEEFLLGLDVEFAQETYKKIKDPEKKQEVWNYWQKELGGRGLGSLNSDEIQKLQEKIDEALAAESED